jgi:hypothetical protein
MLPYHKQSPIRAALFWQARTPLLWTECSKRTSTRHSEQFDWQGNLKLLDTIYSPAVVSNFAAGHVITTSWCIATKTGSCRVPRQSHTSPGWVTAVTTNLHCAILWRIRASFQAVTRIIGNWDITGQLLTCWVSQARSVADFHGLCGDIVWSLQVKIDMLYETKSAYSDIPAVELTHE